MKPDLQRRIQRYGWDKAAPYYNSGWQTQLWPAQQQLLSEAELEQGDSVLDISCGTGLVTQPIAKKIKPGGHVTGIDLSEKMIERARSLVDVSDVENVSFRQMDAEVITFESHSFDHVICSLGLMYFPNPEKAIAEMFRVAKPGASVTALVWGARNNCGWAGIFPIIDRRVETEVCPLFFQLGTGNALKSSFESAGFDDVTSTRFSIDLFFKDDKQACLAAFWGGAVALAYQKFDKTTRHEANKEYLDSVREFKKEDGYAIPGEFVLVKGYKRA